MLISTKHRFVFIHVPKTGGSSITAALAPYLDDPKPVDESQKKGWQIKHHVGKMHATAAESDIPEGFLVVAVRRDHLDWEESQQFHYDSPDWWGNPQEWWTEGVNLKDLCLLRFEHLNDDFEQFCYDVELTEFIGKGLPHLNKHDR